MAGKHVGSDLYPNSNSVYPDRVNRAYMEGYSGVANSHAANSPAALATTAGKTGQQEECAPGTAAVYNQYLQNFDGATRLYAASGASAGDTNGVTFSVWLSGAAPGGSTQQIYACGSPLCSNMRLLTTSGFHSARADNSGGAATDVNSGIAASASLTHIMWSIYRWDNRAVMAVNGTIVADDPWTDDTLQIRYSGWNRMAIGAVDGGTPSAFLTGNLGDLWLSTTNWLDPVTNVELFYNGGVPPNLGNGTVAGIVPDIYFSTESAWTTGTNQGSQAMSFIYD